MENRVEHFSDGGLLETGHFIADDGTGYTSVYFHYFPGFECTGCTLLAGKKNSLPEIAFTSEVYRYHKDRPNEYLGRKHALTKVLAKAQMPKNLRTLVWQRFNETEALNIALLDVEREIEREAGKETSMTREETLEVISLQLINATHDLLGVIATNANAAELRVIADTKDSLENIADSIFDSAY